MFDLSQWSWGQIGLSFLIVIVAIGTLIVALPKFVAGIRVIKEGKDYKDKIKKAHDDALVQLETNTEDIKKLTQKIDDIAGIMTQFVVESEKKDTMLADHIERLEEKINKIEDVQREDRLDRDRSEILEFANRVRNGRRVTLNSWYHVFDIGGKYEKTIKEYNIPNDKFNAEYEWLKHHFKELESNNDFLQLDDEV